jgi:predicted ArsR family transcriptional regulator
MANVGRPSHRQAVIEALPGTRNQLAKRIGISAACVDRLIGALEAEDAIYVVTYAVPTQSPKMPVFALKRGGGNG